MNQTKFIALAFFVVLLGACNPKNNRNEEATASYFNEIKNKKDNAALTQFFAMMPKGGDIHHHYSGAVYVETFLDWAAAQNQRIDTKTFMVSSSPTAISVDSLKKNTVLYRALLQIWSDLDFSNHFQIQDQPDQHFFNTFSYFGGVNGDYRAGLANIKQRAQKENVQYIETMLISPSTKVVFRKTLLDSLVSFQNKQDTAKLDAMFKLFARAIKASPSYESTIRNYLDSLISYHKGIDDSTFTMRFQAYTSRNSSPDVVFARLYTCFDAVTRDKSSLLVGVNIVGPENGIVSMRDYWLHMQMFKFLKNLFPTVKTSMHAGELCLGLVKPEDLTYHIQEAVKTAKANRIGHGVDIPYEIGSLDLLKYMKANLIPVEINLTSNEFILGVKNNDHPINMFLNAGVPIVISTDDAGVSRNNLTSEFVKLASRYNFTYQQIKSFVINSVKYSFMSDSDKAKVLKNLESKFEAFEAKIASK